MSVYYRATPAREVSPMNQHHRPCGLMRSATRWLAGRIGLLAPLLASSAPLAAVPVRAQIDPSAFAARRQRAIAKVPDGLIALHAFSGFKHWDEAGFHQDPAFYYFTGLRNLHRAILVLDGATKESWLFVGPGRASQTPDLTGLAAVAVDTGSASQSLLGIDHVVSWDRFIPFVDGWRAAHPTLPLYADADGQTGGGLGTVSNPDGLAAIENPYLLWKGALHTRWPDLEIRDAFSIVDAVRSVKAPDELALLKRAATATAAGFWAGVHTIAPGRTQREVEGQVIAGCLNAGSTGVSFWPWARSGPYSLGPTLFEAFADYDNLNRTLRAGDVVRLDVGCDVEMYKGDFGRTIPVSGHFDDGQRETLELLNGAYLAGVGAMRPGSTPHSVFDATAAYVADHQQALKTPMAREAAAAALAHQGWALHGLGLDMAEGAPATFEAGNVICYEPLFVAGGQGFFVEDTWVITPSGHERVSPSLPYTPGDIERAMRRPPS
jgi:Xaa-Pro aminopeptidase